MACQFQQPDCICHDHLEQDSKVITENLIEKIFFSNDADLEKYALEPLDLYRRA